MSCFLPVGPRDMWSLIPFSVANAFIATTKQRPCLDVLIKKNKFYLQVVLFALVLLMMFLLVLLMVFFVCVIVGVNSARGNLRVCNTCSDSDKSCDI